MNAKLFYTFLITVCLLTFSSAHAQWFWQNPLPQGNNLNDVVYLNSNVVYSVGFFGIILKSNDGGYNWVTQNSGTTEMLWGIYFIDFMTVFAVGDNGTILINTDCVVSRYPKSYIMVVLPRG